MTNRFGSGTTAGGLTALWIGMTALQILACTHPRPQRLTVDWVRVHRAVGPPAR